MDIVRPNWRLGCKATVIGAERERANERDVWAWSGRTTRLPMSCIVDGIWVMPRFLIEKISDMLK